MTMKEIFAQFAEENNIPMGELKLEPEAPDQLYIRLDGENGSYEGHAMFLEEERMFIFYVSWAYGFRKIKGNRWRPGF